MHKEIDQDLQIAAVMKKLDGGKAILFPSVKGSDVAVIGNLLCCRENCEAAFGTNYQDIRRLIDRAFNNPVEPELVSDPPVQTIKHTKNIDVCFYSFLFGSKMIEVHFTDRDKNREFRDHAISFTKNELKELKEKINDNLHLLGNYEKKIQKSEMNNIHLIRKGIVASKNLEPNSIIKRADLKFARPSSFYGFDKINHLVGKKVKNFIPKNFLIKKKDLGN